MIYLKLWQSWKPNSYNLFIVKNKTKQKHNNNNRTISSRSAEKQYIHKHFRKCKSVTCKVISVRKWNNFFSSLVWWTNELHNEWCFCKKQKSSLIVIILAYVILKCVKVILSVDLEDEGVQKLHMECSHSTAWGRRKNKIICISWKA